MPDRSTTRPGRYRGGERWQEVVGAIRGGTSRGRRIRAVALEVVAHRVFNLVVVAHRVFNPTPAGSGRADGALSRPVGADGPATLARSTLRNPQVTDVRQTEFHQAPRVDPPPRSPTLTLEFRAAPRAEALVGEQVSQRSSRQESPTALETGEWCHEAMLGVVTRYSIPRLNRPRLQANASH
jgi:hypothetical protein